MDKYAELRDALIPIPEPKWLDQGNGVKIRYAADVNDWLKSKNPFDELTETIRALLAERDALREALEAMLEYAGQPISHPAARQARIALAQHKGEKNV